MLQNAYLLAKIGADTAENERSFAENLPTIGNYPTGRPRAALRGPRGRPGGTGTPRGWAAAKVGRGERGALSDG